MCPNCPPQQCAVMPSWPLAQVAHSSSAPLVRSIKTMPSCRASSWSHCWAVPKGWSVFEQAGANSGFGAQLRLCHFLLVNVSVSALWLHGFLFLDTMHGFHQRCDCGAPKPRLWLHHPPTFFCFNQVRLILVSLARHETRAFVLEIGRC